MNAEAAATHDGAGGARAPVLVHLTSYGFAPGSHPGVYRSILALEGLATNVVLAAEAPRYAEDRLDAAALEALRRRDLHVFPGAIRALKKPWLARHLAAGLRRRFRGPSVLVAHLGNNGWRGLALGRALDAPLVTIFHGTDATVDLTSAAYGPRYRRLFEAPGAVFLGVAEHLRERLVAAGAPPERTATFHLGVDPGAFAPRATASGPAPLRLVLVGRMLPVKGHVLAFEALRRLRAQLPDARLALFGDGPLEAELRAEAQRLGVADAVEFHGTVPPAALRAALAEADVALQPSVRNADGMVEGLPNSVLEAMATALPVVASRHGGIPEAVEDGRTGVLVPEGDAAALAEALVALARDPERRRTLGRAGRARVEAEFALPARGRELVARCREALAGYRRRPRLARWLAWQRACRGALDTTGRRQRLAWQPRILANRWRGRIP